MTIDYQKIVNQLNEDLKTKYSSLELRNEFPEFEYEDYRSYFILKKDSYGKNMICFLNMDIYREAQNDDLDHNEDDVVELTKEWFNKYLETLLKLKF